MAVNFSARQFRQTDLLEQIERILVETGITPGLLEIELTESSLIENSEAVLKVMSGLKRLGIRVAVDDFGTGHSSLKYLKRFDVDTLKIDRSFIKDLPSDEEDKQIAQAVIAMGHGMGLKVVAEGVETLSQQAFLREQGCDQIQGYLLSKPLPPFELIRWYQRRKLVRGLTVDALDLQAS